MKPDLFDKHIPELINEQEKETQPAKTVITDPGRVTIYVTPGETLAGSVAAAPPVPSTAPPIIAAPAVRPGTARCLSSSSDEAIQNLFEENSR